MQLRWLGMMTLVLSLASTAYAYCPVSGNTNDEYIDEVTVDGVSYPSGNNSGYFNHSGPVTLSGISFDVALQPGYPNGQDTEQWAIWVDLDHSGTFETTERVFVGAGVGLISGNVNLPPGTPEGETGMRVVMQYGTPPSDDPCATVSRGEIEDLTVSVPPSDTVEMPWQDNAPGAPHTGQPWNYVMGYHFMPNTAGRVTALGGFFDGAKLVRLFDRTTGDILGEVTVSASNNWSYVDLPQPIAVDEGTSYTVAAYLAGSGAAYHYPLTAPFPQTYGSVTIEGSTYAYTGSGGITVRPTNVISYFMVGIADIQFEADDVEGAPWAADCTADDVSAIGISGEMALGPLADIVPLCSGWVVIADRGDNTVKVVQAADGQVHSTYALPAAPADLDLDSDNGWLYVALDQAPGIVKIDLANGSIETIDVGVQAHAVAVGEGTTAFAIIQTGTAWWDRPIAILDGGANTMVSQHDPSSNGDGATLIRFDRVNDVLITGDEGSSPSSLVRYQFDGATLTETEYLWNAGYNGQDLSISPDGVHLAFACGGGNGSGYTVFDYDPLNFTATGGEWDMGAHPRSVDVNPNSTQLAASDGNDIKVFDVATHAQQHVSTPNLSDCSYSQIERVRFSRGGSMVFGFSNCGFSDDSSKLFWTTP